jgi:hypothetical protein
VWTIAELIGWAVAAGVVALVCHLVACAVWPFATCPRCGGNGKRRSPSGKNHGRCRRCKGHGERVRFGRRVWTKLGVAKKKLVG